MRVCVAKKSDDFQWVRAGENISYIRSKKNLRFSELSFTYTLPSKQQEQIYFAYCFPYTFSRLTAFLKQLSIDAADCVKETVLCKSLSGLPVPLLTITSRVNSDSEYNKIKLSEFEDANSRVSLPLYKKKRYAVISGRIHPGETPASWMMHGFVKHLTGNSHQAT